MNGRPSGLLDMKAADQEQPAQTPPAAPDDVDTDRVLDTEWRRITERARGFLAAPPDA
jgi:hypothetical protein